MRKWGVRVSKKAIGFTASLIMWQASACSLWYTTSWGTLKTAGVLLVVAGILFFVYRYLSKSVSTNSVDAGYKKALQQQKRKNKGKGKETVNFKPFPSTQPEKEKSKKAHKFKNTQRRNHSFQVIEGKKNKNERTKTS